MRNSLVDTKSLESRAISTGGCNAGLKFTRGSFKAQSLAWALIEAQGYVVEVGSADTGKVIGPSHHHDDGIPRQRNRSLVNTDLAMQN
jgi:hypothetical protein